jgi:general secretion pathway protein A
MAASGAAAPGSAAAGSRAASAAASAASAAGKAGLVSGPDAGAASTAGDAAAALAAAIRDETSAWRELAPMWGIAAAEGDPCAAAARQQVRCSRFASSLPLIRSLARPGWMNVRDESGRSGAVLLVGLGHRDAVLRANGRTTTVPLAALAKAWQGEFATMWRMPQGYVTSIADGASGPAVDQLAAQLARAAGEAAPTGPQTMDAGLRQKVARFQTAHGLSPVGKAGPTTFMLLNRLTGVDEPRLGAADSPQ